MMEMLKNARAVKADIARLTEKQKNTALYAMGKEMLSAYGVCEE